jgi:cellulose synthase/poly-beta-1,6-N-acetylglucosamine synthase-like glycosyltransferase
MHILDTAASLGLWFCLGLVFYSYAGYPLTLMLRRPRPLRAARGPQPRVTVVIAAFNEAVHIEATVRNKLAQDYPADLLDIVVVSDGSTDRTDAIVASVGDPRVTLLRQEPR